MLDNRKRRRWELIYYLRVFDARNGRQLGHVVDVSVDGLKLVHADAIEMGREFDVRMEFTNEQGVRDRLELSMKSMWTDSDVNADFRVTGFLLQNPTEQATDTIAELIDALHFSGVMVSPHQMHASGHAPG